MNSPLRALRHRNFALFISGQICALMGYWMQQIALSWLVYRLTGSATLLGVLAFVSNLPVLLLAPLAGLMSDRFNRHRMMVATQVFELLQAVILAALAFSGLIAIWHIMLLAIMLGICIAFEVTVRHGYLLELVDDKQDLSSAIATVSLVANCGRLVGPVLGGFVISWFSEATCFLINAFTYVGVLVSFALIHVRPQPPIASPQKTLHGLKEGLSYALHTLPIRWLLALLVVTALTAAPYATLMPALVHELFGGEAETLGFLMGAGGMGAVCGTLLLATLHDKHRLIRFPIAAAFMAGVALIVLSYSRVLALSIALMGIIGFGLLVISVSVNMILQAIVEDDKRGRIMSFYTAGFIGTVPIGGLIAGLLADRIGAAHTVLIGGSAFLLFALYMLRRLPQLKLYLQKMFAVSVS